MCVYIYIQTYIIHIICVYIYIYTHIYYTLYVCIYIHTHTHTYIIHLPRTVRYEQFLEVPLHNSKPIYDILHKPWCGSIPFPHFSRTELYNVQCLLCFSIFFYSQCVSIQFFSSLIVSDLSIYTNKWNSVTCGLIR